MFVYQYILIVHLSIYSVLLFICPFIVSVSLSIFVDVSLSFFVGVSLSSCCCPAIRADFTGVLLPHTSSPNSNAQPHPRSPPRIAHSPHSPRIAHIPHSPRIAHIPHSPRFAHIPHSPRIAHIPHSPRIAHIPHSPRIAHIPYSPRIAHIPPPRRPQCRHKSTGCTLQTTSSPKHYILIVT